MVDMAKECTVTIFGRPIAKMEPRDADYFRSIVVHDCWCADCKAHRLRTAAHHLDVGARIMAMSPQEGAAW